MATFYDLENCTQLATQYIDDIYSDNKLLTKKCVSQIITKIIKSYNTETNDRKTNMHSVITKLSERQSIEDKYIPQLIRLFPEKELEWLHNVCKNGFIPRNTTASHLGIKYLDFIKYNDAGQIGENLYATINSLDDLQKAAAVIEKEQIYFAKKYSKNWEFYIRQFVGRFYYAKNQIQDIFANKFFRKSKEYAQFAITNNNTFAYVDYKQLCADGTISCYKDVLLDIIESEYTTRYVIKKLVENNVWPDLDIINKVSIKSNHIHCHKYDTYKIVIEKLIKDKIIKKSSDCQAFYTCQISQDEIIELFDLFSEYDIKIDIEMLKRISGYSSITIDPDYKNKEYYKLVQKTLSLLPNEINEINDLSDVILHACSNCDEVLFDTLYNLMLSDNKKFIINLDVNKALHLVMESISEDIEEGINIAKTLLNAKATPLLEHISVGNEKNEEVIKMLINYGLNVDYQLLELTIKKGVELNLDDYFDKQQYDAETLYKLCAKHNFFPIKYCKIIGKRAKIHLEIIKLLKKPVINIDEIIKLIDENKIYPNDDIYIKANIRRCTVLIDHLEKKYGMYPNLGTLRYLEHFREDYVTRFAKFHNLEHLIKTQCTELA